MTCAGAFDPESATAEQRAIIAEMCGVESFERVSGRIVDAAGRSAAHLRALWPQ